MNTAVLLCVLSTTQRARRVQRTTDYQTDEWTQLTDQEHCVTSTGKQYPQASTKQMLHNKQ